LTVAPTFADYLHSFRVAARSGRNRIARRQGAPIAEASSATGSARMAKR
jgi:hypothetical protein